MTTLQESRKLIWQSVEGLAEKDLHKKFPDGWNILEVLEHIWLVEKNGVNALRIALQSPPGEEIPIKAANPLDFTVKKVAPERVRPQGVFQSIAQAKEALDAVAVELEEVMRSVDPRDAGKYGTPHPAYGSVSLRQTYQLAPLHELRHLAQIEKIKNIE